MLVTHELQAGTPMLSAAPIPPEQWCGTNGQWMKQQADLARLLRGMPLPLTLLAQRTGPATAYAGPVHDAQAALSFSVLFLDMKLLVGWTAKCPIWVEREIATREATGLPCRAHLWRRSIAGGRGHVC